MHKKKYPFTQNREISWLKFNQRVLEEAADHGVELLERLKFLAIFTSNLDEFFMVRCGSIQDIALVDDTQADVKSGMKPSEELTAIFMEARRLYAMRDSIFHNVIKTLHQLQIIPLGWKNLNKKQLKYVTRYFDTQIKPLLAPQIIDSRHPFPFLINKEQYIFFELLEDGKTNYGIVPFPAFIDRIVYLNDEKTEYILAEDIIFNSLDKLFPNSKIGFKTTIRVTRNADINLDEQSIDDDEDYRQFMKKIMKRRSRLYPVRLEIYKYSNEKVVKYLCRQLGISKDQVFVSKEAPLEMNHIFRVVDKMPEEVKTPLTYKPYVPSTNARLNPERPVIPQILDHDVLMSYPYENIDEFIRLIREASTDPNVVSIKITIYRLAKNSKIVRYLCRAAEYGKEVLVLMELRARFDEQHNIDMAERLEDAGCRVIYGFDEYKVHSKVMQITYKTKNGIKTITQIGTGNYNEKTSRQYTDFSYITSRDDIGKDATAFFQNLAIANLNGTYERLLVSPHSLKESVLSLLDEQIELAKAGQTARADFKMNSLTDLDIIKKLSEASNAGVKIRLIVRGICCLLPGLPGYTENIEIHQIVGRFLEHARLYIFGTGPNKKVFISSADFMTRNTERRVEVAVPIDDPKLKDRLQEYFDIQFQDDRKGRRLLDSGYYALIDPADDAPLDSQEYFMEQAPRDAFKHDPKDAKKQRSAKALIGKVKNLFKRK
ncbi:MAG: polyphosphate kinase 1 [Erysipelotrichaceae bacterium]|nr:polyphosphate kinase 1 [Erysipelotrichaceae bacterium]